MIKTKIIPLFLILSLLSVGFCRPENPQEIQLQKPYNVTLTQDDEGNEPEKWYKIKVDDNIKFPEGQKWFFFVLVEPFANQVWEETQIKLVVEDKSGNQKVSKKCKAEGRVDSCFVNSKIFNPKEGDSIYAHVKCIEKCSFIISAEITNKYKLDINTSLQLDFENTAYTKLFVLNLQGKDFDELRVILKPIKNLNYPAPVQMYANKGWRVPTKEYHEFKSLHIWDDGLGLFIRKSELNQFGMLTISITGPERNVLSLENWLLKDGQVNPLSPFEPQFDYIHGKGQERQYSFTIQDRNAHCYLRTMTFHGNVQIDKISNKDNNKTIEIHGLSAKYSEMDIKIPQKQIADENLTNVIVRVKAKKASTYMIEYYYDTDELVVLKPESTRFSEIPKTRADQFYVNIFELREKNKSSSKFAVSMKAVKGTIKAQFFGCKQFEDTKKCKALNPLGTISSNSLYELVPYLIDSQGNEREYHFEVKWDKFHEKGDSLQEFPLIVIITNESEDPDKILEYYITFHNSDRVYLLKEQQPVRTRVEDDESKLFKFSIAKANISQILVHCVEISGKAKFKGANSDPRSYDQSVKDKDIYTVHPKHRTIHFNDFSMNNGTITVYVEVIGKGFAYFSLNVQVIRSSESNHTQQNASDSTGYNELIINQLISYQFIIKPFDRMVFQAHPSQKIFYLQLHTNLPLDICMTENMTKPPFKSFDNCEVEQKLINDRKNSLLMEYNDVVNFGITNNNDKNATFTIMTSPRDIRGCQQGTMGQTTQHVIRSKSDTFCVSYSIIERQEIDLAIQFENNNFNEDVSIEVRINSKEVIQILKEDSKIKKVQLIKDCGKGQSLCRMEVYITNVDPTKVYVIAQHTNNDVRLLEGLAFRFKGAIQNGHPKYFTYFVANTMQTLVTLQNKVGFYKFVANLVEESKFNIENSQSVFPTNDNSQFKSDNPFYYLHQTLTINESQIRNKCGSSHCILAIAVFYNSTSGSGIEEHGKFIIQASQTVRFLKQSESYAGYLQKNSDAYFSYYHNETGTLAITVSNQNRKCIQTYAIRVQNGTQRATADTIKITNSILSDSEEGTYSIMIHAVESCPYTIQVYSNRGSLSSLYRGEISDINLLATQQKSFIYHHQIDESFKILTLHKVGEVLINVKSYKNDKLQQLLKDNYKSVSADWVGKQIARIDKGSPTYCTGCMYLVQVTGLKQTNASIIVPTKGLQIPISEDQMIRDQLREGQSQIFRIYNGRVASFSLELQYGNITLLIKREGEDTVEKHFSTDSTPTKQTFQVVKSKNNSDIDIGWQFMEFIKVQIKANTNSSFVFGIVSTFNETQRQMDVKFGLPAYLYLSAGEKKTLSGIIENPSQEFLISYDGATSQQLKISAQLQIGGEMKAVELVRRQGENQTIANFKVSIPGWKNSPKKYTFQFTTAAEWLSITFVQVTHMVFLPASIRIPVAKDINFTFHANGKNILEIDQCEGRAVVYISSEFSKVNSLNSTITSHRKTNNIIQFQYWGLVYINVKAARAAISRKYMNSADHTGFGYDQFKGSTVRYMKESKDGDQYLQVTSRAIQRISPEDENSSKIVSITYKAVAATEENTLYTEMNCAEDLSNTALKSITVNDEKTMNDMIKINFSMDVLRSKFEQYRYFLIGMKAIMTLKTKSGIIQKYRFFYQYQEVSRAQLLGGDLVIDPPHYEPDTEGPGFMKLLSYILLVVVLVIIGVFVYRTFLRKLIARRRMPNHLNTEGSMQFQGY